MSAAWPQPDQLAAVIQRLTEGDRLAQSDFVVAVLDPLASHLCQRHRHVEDHLCLTAAEDAVLSLICNPALFDPSKSNLLSFLCMAAERDLLNALKKESRHRRNRDPLDCVELPAKVGNTSEDDRPSFDDPEFIPVIARFTEDERAVFELMRTGEFRTPVFAKALGIEQLPIDEQEQRVKQFKDRIKVRLKRAGGKS